MTYSAEQLKAMCPAHISECSQKHVQSVIAELIETAMAQPASVKERWNIERDGDALLVCFNSHEKGEACRYARFVPEAQPASVPALDKQAAFEAWLENYPIQIVGDDYELCSDAFDAGVLAASPQAPQPAQAVQTFTEGHCDEKRKPGGCQLHNLHCGYPACDRKAAAPGPAVGAELSALDALAELCDEATGGWDLPPSAVARIGALARKARARQDPGAYDRGVITGLRQAAAICADREDMTADRIRAEIEACIGASHVQPKGTAKDVAAPQPEAQLTTNSYRKKPVVIEAIQWDGSWGSMEAIKAAFPAMEVCASTLHPPTKTVRGWSIRTLEGSRVVSVGDYIIKGVKGEFYPCKPDIFAMTYEPAAPSAQAEAQPVPAAWIRWEWNRSGSKSLVFDKPAELSLSEEARGVVYSPLYAAPSAQAESSAGEDSTAGLRRMLDLINDTDSARWEVGFRNIVAILYGARHRFEIAEVVERVRELAAPSAQAEQTKKIDYRAECWPESPHSKQAEQGGE